MSFKLADFNEKTQAKIRAQLRDDVRRVEAHQSEQAASHTLERCLPKREGGTRGVVCVVSFVALLGRTLDDDNLIASLKPLRDAVAASLGIDDGDPRIRFQYEQLQTKGQEGVMVHLETL